MTATDTIDIETRDFGKVSLCYIMYLVGFIFPIAALAGLVFAYMQEPSGHRQFAIRTFWWGLLILFVGSILTLLLVGWLILLAWAIWTLTRVFSGWSLARDGKDISIPTTLGFMAR